MRPLVALVLAAAACGQESSPQRPVISGSASGSGSGSATPSATAALAASGPIQLAASTKNAVLELTMTNTSSAPVAVATHVVGGRVPHYDWLRVELTGTGRSYTLGFIDDRDKSAPITLELAAGAAHTERIDLVPWAVAGGNDGPLLPGSYELRATWDASNESSGVRFVGVASTTLVIEPPGAEGCDTPGYKAPAGAKLVLLGRQHPTGRATVDAGLYNAGDAAVCVFSHVATHELHYDAWTVLYADGAKYHHVSRQVRLDDARDKSYRVNVLLGPGQTIWHTFDVDDWARRDRNGKEALPATGSLYTQITYDTKAMTDVWAGSLTSDAFGLSLK